MWGWSVGWNLCDMGMVSGLETERCANGQWGGDPSDVAMVSGQESLAMWGRSVDWNPKRCGDGLWDDIPSDVEIFSELESQAMWERSVGWSPK
ncbi:hypothetical protein chiPu_0021090 [Chiloscyllium punctatum]|uniref:SRCR domain-containing protein n=1 Tax=Chiloscyllium punctatum TaxID=137246 RepID=A0A401RN05_CHIPU|nr:hypothetical protein [Chiloscyllium punctatum]